MIIFVVLGMLILVVSFFVAFASLIYEQKSRVETEEDLEPSRAIEEIPEERNSTLVADSSDIKIVEEAIFQEDRLKTADTEIFPWEQGEEGTPAQGQDFVTLPEEPKPVQRLSGVISIKDMLSKS